MNKENEKEKTTGEKNLTEETDSIEEVISEQNEGNSLKDLMRNILSNLSSPLVLTTIITAIAAPFITGEINSQIHEKETQTKILEAVIQTTEKSDLSKLEAIERLQIIASMVHENRDKFQINLDKTLALVDNKIVDGTLKLRTRIEVIEKDKTVFQNRILADSLLKIETEKEKKSLIQQKERLQASNQTNKSEIRILDAEINKKEELITGLTEKDIRNKKQLELLNSNLQVITEKYEQAQEKLDDLLAESSRLKDQNDNYEELLSNSETKEQELRTALKEAKDNLTSSREVIQELSGQLSTSQLDYEKLSSQVIGYEEEIANLKIALQLAEVPKIDLVDGSRGADVKRLQQILIKLNYFDGVDDGQYGPATIEAITKFQLQNKIDTLGIAGKYENLTRITLQNRYVSVIQSILDL